MNALSAIKPTFSDPESNDDGAVEPGLARSELPRTPSLVEDAASPLFRHEAIQAYQRGDVLSSPLAIVPLTSRVVLITFGLAITTALAILIFGHVELVSRGRGVVRAEQGVQPLLFPTAGVVREVMVHVGDVVRAGQPIARLEATALVAGLAEAESELQTVATHAERERVEQEANSLRDSDLLNERATLTQHRIRSLESSRALLLREDERVRSLQEAGLATAQTISQSSQILAEQERSELAARAELASIEQERAALEHRRRAAATERSQRVRQAEVRRDAARSMLNQTLLIASRDGRVESLMVTTGEAVLPTTLVARLVPVDGSDFVTAFVPERDRAFVTQASRVQVEFDQFPVGEFGSAPARIVRVSTETAGAAEMSQVLAAAAPVGVYFRVELKLEPDAHARRFARALSSGSLLTIRVTLRKRRIIGFALDPVRKWLD